MIKIKRVDEMLFENDIWNKSRLDNILKLDKELRTEKVELIKVLRDFFILNYNIIEEETGIEYVDFEVDDIEVIGFYEIFNDKYYKLKIDFYDDGGNFEIDLSYKNYDKLIDFIEKYNMTKDSEKYNL